MPLHLIRCECGNNRSVRPSMAGETLECSSCGDSIAIPALSQFSNLPLDTQTEDVRWFDLPAKRKIKKSYSLKHLFVVTAASGLLLAVTIYLFGPMGALRDPVFDAPVITDIQTSTNLERDKSIMWNTATNKNGTFHVAPVSAINASRRVFESLRPQLIGKNREEVRELIGFTDRTEYGYHGAFFGVDRHAYVYRFDCGNFGWQYNLYLNDDRIVTDVEYLWIH